MTLSEQNLNIMQYYHHIHSLFDSFVRGNSAEIYNTLIPIAQMQFHFDPKIAQIQKEIYNEFMLLNGTLYNAPTTVRAEYPLFDPTAYARLNTMRHQCIAQDRARRRRRITAATLCL